MTKTGKEKQEACKSEQLTCLFPLTKAAPPVMKLTGGPRVLGIPSWQVLQQISAASQTCTEE